MSEYQQLRIAFIIDRLTNYRMFSSLIAEGVQRGIQIECWHLCENRRKNGNKGYLYPSLDKARFKEEEYTGLTLRSFDSTTAMMEAVATRNDLSHVVAMNPPETLASKELLERFTATWCIIMYGQDTFRNLVTIKNGPAGVVNIKTIFFSYSSHLFDFGMAYVDRFLPKAKAYMEQPNLLIRHIGNTMLDPKVHHLNKEIIRDKYGIPSNKNIAIYLPYGYLPAKNYTHSRAWQAAFSGMHIDRISEKSFDAEGFINEQKITQLKRKATLASKAIRDPVARKWLFNGWHEPAIIKSVRQFCDSNDLYLVVKPRRKFDFSEAVYQQADLIVDDNESQYFPSMMQELLSIAAIGVSFFSWAVLEFVYQRVPVINIECLDDRNEDPSKKYWHSTKEGSIYSYTGNVWNYSAPDFIKKFPGLSTQDFAIDEQQRGEYFRRFLGQKDNSAAELFYDTLENQTA